MNRSQFLLSCRVWPRSDPSFSSPHLPGFDFTTRQDQHQSKYRGSRFREKWGDERAAGYSLSENAPGPKKEEKQVQECLGKGCVGSEALGVVDARPRVSLCMIVKNEEARLGTCLGSVGDLVDEIVVIDTGSTDQTKEIAAGFGARVFDFPWQHSFAAARNESLLRATGRWIFWLDADERLDDENRAGLRELFSDLRDDNVSYLMRQRSALEDHQASVHVDQVRLFPNRPELRWEYRAHEQILPGLRRLGVVVRSTSVAIDHGGFTDPALQGAKLERNLRLLEMEAGERPDDPFLIYNLGVIASSQGRAEDALSLLRQALALLKPGDRLGKKVYIHLLRCHRSQKQLEEAMSACRAGRSQHPEDAELLFWEGVLLRELGYLAGAEVCFSHILHMPQGQNLMGADAGLQSYRTRHVLAETYQLQGRLEDAEIQWRAALAERHDFEPARLGLAKLRQGGAKTRPRVSLCMIVKNEEPNLASCLNSVADLVDEIVLVDTGSTDETKAIAARFGARIYDFPWVDSFAAARNESLSRARGEWVFWLDADDRIDETNRDKLRGIFASVNGDNAAYVMKCLCLPDKARGGSTVVDHVRLFRNQPDLRWTYRAHEQILPALRRAKADVRWSDVVIHHTGYQDAALRAGKLKRDLRLVSLDDAERPDDPFNMFNLGCIHQELGQIEKAVGFFRRSLDRSHPGDSIVRKLYALLVQCHRQLDQKKEALAACRAGRNHYPDDGELLFQQGLLLRENDDPAGAEGSFLRLLNTSESAHFASVDPGLRSYLARHNLAVIYRGQGRIGDAELQWRQAVTEHSSFLPAWIGLGELYLAARRWDALEDLARAMERPENGFGRDATMLRSRAEVMRPTGLERLS